MFGIDKRHLAVLCSLWLLVHVLIVWRLGIRDSLFDSVVYMEAADFLLANGGFKVFHYVFYALPISLMALFKLLFQEVTIPFVIFQCLLSGVAMLCLYRAATCLFSDKLAGLISAVVYICCWDVIQWNTTVMTESIACSLICFVILILARFKGRLRDYVILAVTVAACLVARPTGVLVPVGVCFFFFARHWNALDARPLLKGAILLTCTLVAFLGARFMFSYWDFTEQYSKGNIVTYMDTMQGQDYYEEKLRLDTSGLMLADEDRSPVYKIGYFIWHNPVHFFTAAALKIYYLLSGTRPYYSFVHNFYSIVWLTVIYLLLVIALRQSLNSSVVGFCLSVIVLNCILVGIAAVDWDNRFYVPMQPAIALLAGVGGASFIRYLNVRIRSLDDRKPV